MNFQRKKFTCGPASASNALEALGHVRTEDELAQLMGTTPDGTSPKQMLKGLEALKESCHLVGPAPFQEANAQTAFLKLLEALRLGRPVITCVKTEKPWDHWALVAGLLGSAGEQLRLVFVDSGSADLLYFYTPAQFIERWKGPDENRHPYYGIIV